MKKKASLKDVASIVKQLKWGSLFTKFFITFFISLIFPISLLNVFIYTSSQSSIKKEFDDLAKQSALITANTLNTTLNSYYNDYLLYLDDVNVQKFLLESEDRIASVDFFSVLSEIRKEMDLHILSSTYLNSIYLYSFTNHYIITNDSANKVEYFNDTNWLDYYNKNKKSFYITPQKSSYDSHISICYEIADSDMVYGIIVFNLDLYRLKNTLFSDSKSPMISTALYNDEHEPVFVIGENLIQHDFSNDNDMPGDIKSVTAKGYLHCYTPLEHAKNILQVSFTTESLSMKRNHSIAYLFLGFVMCFLLAGFLSAYLSFRFYHSVSNTIMQITESNISDLSSDKSNPQFDEASFISQNITKLMMKHSLLEGDLYHKIANLKRMQILTLQSQLNPHFIFNTLNHINILTLDAGKKGEMINMIICNLSELLRSSLESNQYIVDAKTEISYIKQYLEIETIKYCNKFDVHWNIDERILHCAVVKFMLQPIVENAFVHGIHKAINGQKGLLCIQAQIVNKNIVFQIKNNGAEIDSARLEEIRSLLNTDDLPDSKHIGLCNVHQRVKLIFGEEYGITRIDSASGETIVEITIPWQEYS